MDEKQHLGDSLLELAYRKTRMKEFVLELPPAAITKMAAEHKLGGCFITHKFGKDDGETNLLVHKVVPTKRMEDEYLIIAEDYGQVH